MIPEFLKQIDWKLLTEQKQYLIDLDHPHADGVVSLLDSLQDYCVDVLGIDEGEVFSSLVNEPAQGKKERRFKLISNPNGIWKESSGLPMELGRIVALSEIFNEEPFSYWYEDQEHYFEEVYENGLTDSQISFLCNVFAEDED